MHDPDACPVCAGENVYADAGLWICADCGHEWDPRQTASDEDTTDAPRDCNGQPLQAGDSVVVTKDLKVKGSSVVLKQGTVIRSIRLVDGDPGHVEGSTDRIKGVFVKTAFVRRQ